MAVKLDTFRVFLVDQEPAFIDMYQKAGWDVVDNLDWADLMQFTGGEDVSPILYGEHEIQGTFTNRKRDAREMLFYQAARKRNMPMAGVCRGGQFLYVMAGGALYQDVDKHTEDHNLDCLIPGMDGVETIRATSTHHQMMRSGLNNTVVLGWTKTEGKRTWASTRGSETSLYGSKALDLEVVFHKPSRALCFQPHPEYSYASKELRDLYFTYIYQHCLGGGH